MAPPSSPQRPEFVLQRSRSVLIVVGALVSVAAFFLFRRFPPSPGASHALNWLAAVALLGAAAVWFRERKISDFLALGMAVLAIRSVLPETAMLYPGALIATTTTVVLWAGLVLPPLGALVLATYAFAAPWIHGVPVAFTADDIGAGKLIFTLHIISVLLPLGLALLARGQQRDYVRALLGRFDTLARREGELSARVAQQAKELDLSQQKLSQANKLETVGTMASGLAHELNNLLTPIRGMAELVAMNADDAASRRYGRRILDAAESAASITGALLTYARKGSFSPVRTNLRVLLEGQVLPVLTQSIPEAIELHTEFEDKLSADVDRVLFQQSITNLVFNAIDAMPNGGSLSLRLYADDRSQSLRDSGTDHGAAVIEIEDTGEGMKPETLEHIFDPFFTTKPVGSGTGLGLAMVHGCVVRHGGEVTVESTPGKGSTFRLYFPLSRTAVPSRPWPVLGNAKNKPVVVVASAEEDTRDELEEMLSDLACTPIASGDLATLRNMLAEVGERVDLMIIDHTEQSEVTRRFVRDARGLLPDLPLTILTDGGRDAVLDRLLGTATVRFVRAPVDGVVLGALLSELLRPAGYELPYWALPAGASTASMTAMASADVFEQKRAQREQGDSLHDPRMGLPLRTESDPIPPAATPPAPSDPALLLDASSDG